MPQTQLITYRKFNDLALTEPLIAILQEHDIEYELVDSPGVNVAIAFNDEINKEYDIKINPSDFDKVNAWVLEDEAKHIDDVDSDYYLFAFTDDELMDVLQNYNEWGSFDIALARKLLNERGVPIDDIRMSEIKAQAIETMRQPEKSERIWVFIGYLSALLGGVLGIFIGWYLSSGKKTLPNGERVYVYNDADRKHGNRIFFIGIVIFIAVFGFRLYTETPKN